MPAKKKYLSGGWTRLSKVIAALLGGYVATALFHIAIATNVADDTPVLLTATFTVFLMWAGLMILVFFMKKAWMAWAMIFSISIVSSLFIYL